MTFYRGRSVLVAGGAGLVGQSLIRALLAAGAHVRATQYRARRILTPHPRLEVVTCDLRDPAAAEAVFRDMEIALLCAGLVRGAKGMTEDPSSILMYNLDLQSRLIAQAAKAKVARCSFISSSYVYPQTGRPNREEEGFQGDPWIPTNYGMGWYHRYLETLCRHFHLMSSTRFCIVRPTVMYGPHDTFDLADGHVIPASIVKAVDRLDPYVVWGTGQEVRCFTYVDDFVEGLLRAVEGYAVAEALNVCTAETATVRDVLAMLFEHLGFHPDVVYEAGTPSAVPYKVSDPSRARAQLGWAARVRLRDGLARTTDWYAASRLPAIAAASAPPASSGSPRRGSAF